VSDIEIDIEEKVAESCGVARAILERLREQIPELGISDHSIAKAMRTVEARVRSRDRAIIDEAPGVH
jgi:hypothetical protein